MNNYISTDITLKINPFTDITQKVLEIVVIFITLLFIIILDLVKLQGYQTFNICNSFL